MCNWEQEDKASLKKDMEKLIRRKLTKVGNKEIQCQYMTNCAAIAELIERSRAGMDIAEIARQGAAEQRRRDAEGEVLLATVNAENPNAEREQVERLVPPEEDMSEAIEEAWDDVSGKALDPDRVREARRLEMEYYDKMQVYDKVPIEECYRKTGKAPLKARWIDIDKGDRYRSRWVAKQFKNSDGEEWFAATPPLEALRAVISKAVSHRAGEQRGKRCLMLNDVSRAFFYAPVQHEIYVELCPEALRQGETGICGKLKMSMYGTKAAAQNWQRRVQKVMKEMGFIMGKSSPVVFYHPLKDIVALVHGDDFVSAGGRAELEWMREKLASKFEITTKMVGEDCDLLKDVKILNRRVRWVPGVGIEYEADHKHAEELIREAGVQGKKPLSSPMVREKAGEKDAEKEEDIQRRKQKGKLGAKTAEAEGEILEGPAVSKYRGMAARANYLAQDRPDLAYAAKELTRKMQHPTVEDEDKMRRFARYLIGRPRVKLMYHFQEDQSELTTFSDTDWAGCRRTRRSTSGGYTMRGAHLMKIWCKTQAVVALSSAEAELYGLVRAAAETLGGRSLWQDLGEHMSGRVMGDASAALGIISRQGIGKLRHLNTNYLWVQEQAMTGNIAFDKVSGHSNAADLFTKPLAEEDIRKFTEKMSGKFVDKAVPQDEAKMVATMVTQARCRMGLEEHLKEWRRTDLNAKNLKTSLKGGPPWTSVGARISIDLVRQKLLKAEKAGDILRANEHEIIEHTDLLTVLLYKPAKVARE